LKVVGEGGGVLPIDLYEAVDISVATKNILIDSGLRELLVKNRLERVRGFTWDKCARGTLEAFKNV
jgi:glycosyltransferase involved in cell wall biosynthesis